MSAARDVLLSAKRALERDKEYHEREWLSIMQQIEALNVEAQSRAKKIDSIKQDIDDVNAALRIVR